MTNDDYMFNSSSTIEGIIGERVAMMPDDPDYYKVLSSTIVTGRSVKYDRDK